MANADAPFGLRPVSKIDGSDWKGSIVKVAILAADNTATFKGDPVALTGTASADGKYPSVAQSTAGGAIDFVIVDFEPDFSTEDLNTNYRLPSTLRYAYAVPVVDTVFEIQEDSDGGSIAITAVGEFCDLIIGSGNTTTGISGVELNSSDAGTGDGVRIIGIGQDADNELGTNAVWRVVVNESNLFAVGTAV